MPFSKQELNVLYMLSKGLSNDEIMDLLKIKKGTLKAHKQSIKRKLMGTGIRLKDMNNLSPRLFKRLQEFQGDED